MGSGILPLRRAQGSPGDQAKPGAWQLMVLNHLTGPDGQCAGATDDEAFGMLGQWGAAGSWLESRKLGVIREMIRRRPDAGNVGTATASGLPWEWDGRLANELALELRVSVPAARTLLWHGEESLVVADVGVAGLWRLLERVDELREMPVLIVAAGMDAAMVSVLGGLVPGALVAVPTSIGYGAARNGENALHAALASCAPGIAVVNIDNGYGAACAALRILRAAERIAAAAGAATAAQ